MYKQTIDIFYFLFYYLILNYLIDYSEFIFHYISFFEQYSLSLSFSVVIMFLCVLVFLVVCAAVFIYLFNLLH